MLAAKRLAHVAPEVDLGKCTLHLPLQKVNKAEPTLALKPRGDITRNPKQDYQWPQKGHVCPPKTFFLKNLLEGSHLRRIDSYMYTPDFQMCTILYVDLKKSNWYFAYL